MAGHIEIKNYCEILFGLMTVRRTISKIVKIRESQINLKCMLKSPSNLEISWNMPVDYKVTFFIYEWWKSPYCYFNCCTSLRTLTVEREYFFSHLNFLVLELALVPIDFRQQQVLYVLKWLRFPLHWFTPDFFFLIAHEIILTCTLICF